MSRKVIFAVCLFVAVFVGTAAFPYETASFESIVIDNFDEGGDGELKWEVNCSRDATADSKRIGYVVGMPNALRNLADEDSDAKVLGVKAKFDRKGSNWIEIFPTEKEGENAGKPKAFPLKGHVSQMDVWVWGLGYKYSISVLLRDTSGVVREVPLGSLDYNGWRNLSCKIPASILQTAVYRGSSQKTLAFVGFRITTSPSAPVDDISIYFDNFKYLTNSYVNLYDGYELNDAKFEGEDEDSADEDYAEDEDLDDGGEQ